MTDAKPPKFGSYEYAWSCCSYQTYREEDSFKNGCSKTVGHQELIDDIKEPLFQEYLLMVKTFSLKELIYLFYKNNNLDIIH